MTEPTPNPSRQPGGERPAWRRRVPGDVRLWHVPIVAALAGALIVGGLIDQSARSATDAAASAPQPFPAVAPAAAISSSWFCAGATDSANGSAPGSVVLANEANTPATGVVTLVTTTGTTVKVPVTIAGDSRAEVPENVSGGAPWIGAIVDIDAGDVGVQQQIGGALGRASSPCATAGSSQWYFTSGATLINASVTLSLLNPYPTAAVADMSFTTDQGQEFPSGFQGLVVPANGLLTVNLGDHLRRRQTIATTVTARSGRLVVWKTDVVTPPQSGEPLLGTPSGESALADPASPIPGVTLTLGAPAAETTWAWPEGATGNGLNEQYVIYNPGLQTADLQLSIDLDAGEAEPFQLTVGPGQAIPVISNQEVRIPPGVGHAALLQSLNGVPVVAERTVSASSPSTWYGLGEVMGSAVIADDWLLPAGQTDATHSGWVFVYNPGRIAVTGSLTALRSGTPVQLKALNLGPGKRAQVEINALVRLGVLNDALTVTMSGPVYVEIDYYGIGGTPGLNLSPGIPAPG